MSLQNPFFLNQQIFSADLKQSLNLSYEKFVEEFFYNWILFILLGEFETTVAYPIILNNLKLGKYDGVIKMLSDQDKKKVYQYFDQMIADEKNHTNLIDKLLANVYNESIPAETLNLVVNDTKNLIENSELTSLLIRYYVGECYLWTGFYLLYKQTDSVDNQKLFHKLLVDESHHNNNIYKFFKLIKDNAKLDHEEFVASVSNLKYFGFPFVMKKLELPNINSKKDKWWIKTVYDYEWQTNFNKIFLKKCFQLYKVFNPKTNFEDFFKLINKNELDWIPCRS